MDSIRQTIGKALEALVGQDSSVIALTADLASSVGMVPIREKHPKQFIQCGIAEQEMMSLSAGLALSGSKPFCGSFAAFNPGRNWDQLRNSVCYNHAPVRVISSHYGLSVGGDGATHQCLEYLALTLPLPNLDVLIPFNNSSALYSMNFAYSQNNRATVIFQPRESHTESIENVQDNNLINNGFSNYKSQKGEAETLIISAGLISSEVFKLEEDQESKPVDFVFLVNLTGLNIPKLTNHIKKYLKILIVEEHQEFGGIASLIYQILVANKIAIDGAHICLRKEFGHSAANGQELWKKYGLDVDTIKKYI
ncbi:hypothetical protein HC864_03915 [Candidatus Gracilibacteria bacterium]|nr:hypothetical protein [Candidatus Gracilibacteria bacterium]